MRGLRKCFENLEYMMINEIKVKERGDGLNTTDWALQHDRLGIAALTTVPLSNMEWRKRHSGQAGLGT